MNLPKETKDLYIENYKTLMKEIKDDTNRWRNKCFNFKMFQKHIERMCPLTWSAGGFCVCQ